MVKVLQISRKYWRYAFASSCAFLSSKLASLHHVDESWLELESIVSNIDIRSSTDIDGGWSREFIESC
jgi:hypothetical protein